MPNLIEVQKNSYKWFLEEGLKEVFKDISEISDYQGNLVLDFIDYRLDEKPKYSIEECKERDATFAAPLRVRASLLNKETGEVKEQDIFMGDFPVMTPSGTFIINGAERVIVSQLVRSPGVYYSVSRDKAGKELFATTVIPNRGAWLEYETDSTMSSMSVLIKTESCRLPPLSVLWAFPAMHRFWISLATISVSFRPSKRTAPTIPRRLCWRSTESCVRANLQQ